MTAKRKGERVREWPLLKILQHESSPALSSKTVLQPPTLSMTHSSVCLANVGYLWENQPLMRGEQPNGPIQDLNNVVSWPAKSSISVRRGARRGEDCFTNRIPLINHSVWTAGPLKSNCNGISMWKNKIIDTDLAEKYYLSAVMERRNNRKRALLLKVESMKDPGGPLGGHRSQTACSGTQMR